MKSNLKTYFLAIIFLFLFTACTSNNLISEASISTSSNSSQDSLSVGSTPVAAIHALGGLTENNKKPEKEELRFRETSDSPRGQLDYFADEDGTEYVFLNETGEFLSFIKIRSRIAIGSEITEREAQLIADATAVLFVDISKYDYRDCQPSGGYPDGTNFQVDSYDFSYSKTLSGYRTTEGIAVWTAIDGTVLFVSLFDVGKFDGLTEPKIDEKQLDAKFLTEVRKQFGNDAVVAQIHSRILDYENSQFIMRYDFFLDYGEMKQVEIPL